MDDEITQLVNAWYLDFAGCTYDEVKNKEFDKKLQILLPHLRFGFTGDEWFLIINYKNAM
ncbi:MAG: hypothetical protein EOO20_05415 [Chryseobacterium sp.]|nr:MAG: hypothetical protein EOO20_05415 [Chryseobacterium sp.]